MKREDLIKLVKAVGAFGLMYYWFKTRKDSHQKNKEFRAASKYVNKKGLRLSLTHKQLISETKQKFPKRAIMLGGKDTAFLMANLIKIQNQGGTKGNTKGFEIGVFTGFSTLVMAEALPEDGKIIALDINKEYTDLAQKYWQKAKVANKIELSLGSAVEHLTKLTEDKSEVGTYDFAFVDADKINYPNYYELLLILLKKGGWICFDNAFCGGNLTGLKISGWKKTDIECMDLLNERLNCDERVSNVLLDIADGVHMVVKN